MINIHIDNLSKEEYAELVKHLDIQQLRVPIITENKLAKKYIKGFRPANAPIEMIIQAYYQEIRNGNNKMRKIFSDVINELFVEIELEKLSISLSNIRTVREAIDFGSDLIDKNVKLDFDLLLKLLDVQIDEQYREVILSTQRIIKVKVDKVTAINERLRRQLEELENENEKKKKEVEDLKKGKEKNKILVTELKKENMQLQENLSERESVLSEKKLLLSEQEGQIQKQIRYLEESEKTILSLEKNIENQLKQISGLHEEKIALVKERDSLKEKRIMQYEDTILRLVKDTIAELKDNYKLSQEQFECIMSEIDEPHTIAKVWKKLSHNNQEVVENIEIALKREHMDMDIIDQCDEVENHLLVKYIIVKAIKAAIFENMSYKEKHSSLADIFDNE